MSDKIINLAAHFNATSLITRQAARDLFELIARIPGKNIVLDFSQIQYATRSFFDELHAADVKIRLLAKEVKSINLNENISRLLELVKDQSHTRNNLSFTSVANVKTISI